MDKVIVSGLLIIASITAAVMTISIIVPGFGSNSESIVRTNRVASDFASTALDGLAAEAVGGSGVTISAWFKNVGSVDVQPISAVEIFLLTGDRRGGRYVPFSSSGSASDSWEVVQPVDSNVWARGEILQIQLTLEPVNPISPGTYKVSLKTPNGISADISFEYAQTPLPTPPPTPTPAPTATPTPTPTATPTPASSVVFIRKWGTPGSGDGEFLGPNGVAAAPDGSVYVADTNNHRIQKFTADGVFVRNWGTSGTGDDQFSQPYDIAVALDGSVYVADTFNARIGKFTGDGVFVRNWGTSGTGDGQFSRPEGIAVASDGSVHVADTNNHRIQKFTADGVFVRNWGTSGSGDGEFRDPTGVSVASDGSVYVTDRSNGRIQKFSVGP